jgi:hypothetical protein
MRLERISARRNSLPQIAQQICELALDAAFVYVMVPTAAIEEGNFEVNIRFEQFRDFHQTLPEAILRILRTIFGLIFLSELIFFA